MGEWGAVVAAVIAGIASAFAAWIGLSSEPRALRTLKALNDVVEKIENLEETESKPVGSADSGAPADPPKLGARDELVRARDLIASRYAAEIVSPHRGAPLARTVGWFAVSAAVALVTVFVVLAILQVENEVLSNLVIVGAMLAGVVALVAAGTGFWLEVKRAEGT